MASSAASNPGGSATWRQRAHLGRLDDNFLVVGSTSNQYPYVAAGIPQPVTYNHSFGFSTSQYVGRLSILIAEAKLAKNYGITKMDPYCRIRVAHSVFETPTSYSGSKTPRWNKTIECFLPVGVDSFLVEIYDEKTFTVDDRIAWGHVEIPPGVIEGATVDEWFSLTGRQGDCKEGMINIVMSLTPMTMVSRTPVIQNPSTLVYQPLLYPVPPVALTTAVAAQAPGVAAAQRTPQQQQSVAFRPPTISDQDVAQLKEMFPETDDEVIRAVLEERRGDRDEAVNALLAVSDTG